MDGRSHVQASLFGEERRPDTRERRKSSLDFHKPVTLLMRVALILKVVRNLFQTFHLVDLDGRYGPDII